MDEPHPLPESHLKLPSTMGVVRSAGVPLYPCIRNSPKERVPGPIGGRTASFPAHALCRKALPKATRVSQALSGVGVYRSRF